MTHSLHIIILAAGQGTRMKSSLPKILHKIGGKPLLERAIDATHALGAEAIHVIYGHGGEQVKKALSHCDVNWVEQTEQLGTGHAVLQAMPAVGRNKIVLITYGDVPLITGQTLENIISQTSDNSLALLTAQLLNPTGYGRIIRNDFDKVCEIVEEKDATATQKQVKEINTGMLAVSSDLLLHWLEGLNTNNAQGEYYLTDIIAMAVKEGIEIKTISPNELVEIEGVNNKRQLANLERVYQGQQVNYFLDQGVTFADPARFDLRGELIVGSDVEIDVNVVIEGQVSLGDRVRLGPNNVIINTSIGDDTTVLPNCVIENATIGKSCDIGPFSRIRPDTRLADQVKVGNFVEIKKSTVASGSKVNHLSYVGDTTMGARVNVGAGTITCNYDGANKHQTIIGDDVFIGSDTQLVAPIEVGEGATIGAGSTVTHDAPAQELTLSRAPQKCRKGWKRPVKNK